MYRKKEKFVQLKKYTLLYIFILVFPELYYYRHILLCTIVKFWHDFPVID